MFNIRQYLRGIAFSASADVKAYVAGKIEHLPKLIAREVLDALIALRDEKLEPARDKVLDEINDFAGDIEERYPIFGVARPFLRQVVAEKIETHPALVRIVDTYGSVESFLGSLNQEDLTELFEDVMEYVTNRIEARFMGD